jgi:hypothetical protein
MIDLHVVWLEHKIRERLVKAKAVRVFGGNWRTRPIQDPAIASWYPAVRWTDRWGTRWENKRGEVRRIRDDELWEP